MISFRPSRAAVIAWGALHTDGGRCTLSVSRELKVEIPVTHPQGTALLSEIRRICPYPASRYIRRRFAQSGLFGE